MKNKKILMTLVSFLVSLILISCGLGIKDTVQDVTSEIHRESSKEDTEGLGIKQVLEQKNGENVDISTKDFTGYIYIMSTKENIESIRKSEFNINNDSFQDVKKGSEHDFNIRYNSKTFFSVKQIKVESVSSVKISSNYSENILLVLREENDKK